MLEDELARLFDKVFARRDVIDHPVLERGLRGKCLAAKDDVKQYNLAWVGKDKTGKVIKGELRATGDAGEQIVFGLSAVRNVGGGLVSLIVAERFSVTANVMSALNITLPVT